jgi:hypothetical protein
LRRVKGQRKVSMMMALLHIEKLMAVALTIIYITTGRMRMTRRRKKK